MKLLLLCLLPVVLCAPLIKDQKRFLWTGFDISSIFDLDTLKCDVQKLLDKVGSDPSEQACEDECYKLVQEGHYLAHGCPLVCHSVQNLAQYFHETPKPGDASLPCGGLVTQGTK
ncbi:uncharacterized protein LOC128555100 [Mercenaria mercenaria]|uniref:uncharacterized protein LOC128555100 n=1 Tax=Mercenaria mercenaria TaxID=6596 RepID=UPI00234F078F|nr:uncharacterized protein LOC128555100 [Mercenaria mercenaria]XP_053392493.1 uncharacterized protein LOC128555100 [Mercenaria mercenaria]